VGIAKFKVGVTSLDEVELGPDFFEGVDLDTHLERVREAEGKEGTEGEE
jgi:hypothetical protein